ncbi:MAG: hypothetical protein SFT93_05800 [Rickettsiaceae bacterium]|nr:hypothetical protein [Rickettsiaceae bacterium]
MSISIALDFQAHMQSVLENTESLSLLVKHISHSVKPATKYPYIYHKFKNISVSDDLRSGIYDVEYEVNIYSRDIQVSLLKRIIKTIENKIIKIEINAASFIVISSKISNYEIIPSNDLVTLRSKIIFFSSIKPR